MEGVEDERNEAEDVEVRALGGRPAPQQDVNADAEINQRDQSQAGIKRAIGGYQDDGSIDRHSLPYQRVRGLGPDPHTVELLLEGADVRDLVPIDRNQTVARLDTGSLARTIRLHP